MRRTIAGTMAAASLLIGSGVVVGIRPVAAATVGPPGSLPTLGGDVPLVGDWDGNGTTTIGIRRGNVFHLRNSNTTGAADLATGFGDPGDLPVVGDWDGNGTTTIGRLAQRHLLPQQQQHDRGRRRRGRLRRSRPTCRWWATGTATAPPRSASGAAASSTCRNANTTGAADIAFGYGDPGDVPVVGDWDGNGTTTLGLRRANTFLLRNENTTGAAQVGAVYGDPGDVGVAGDWDGDGTDTVGVRRGATFFLRNSNTSGPGNVEGDLAASYGDPTIVAAPVAPSLAVDVIAAGLTNPWDLAFTPDGAMLVTERPGRLSVRLPDGTFRTLVRRPLRPAGLRRDRAHGRRGRPELCRQPPLLHLPGAGRGRRCRSWPGPSTPARHRRPGGRSVGRRPALEQRAPRRLPAPHRSRRRAVHRNRRRGDGTNPQDLASLGGKVLRVDPATGQGLPGNPFFGAGGDPRIFSFGHRNVQGLALRPGTSEMWAVEQGTDRDDEVNLLQAGGNYGWTRCPATTRRCR